MKNPTFFDDFYTCIGLFEVKKKDILFLTEHMNENEVIAYHKLRTDNAHEFPKYIEKYSSKGGVKSFNLDEIN